MKNGKIYVAGVLCAAVGMAVLCASVMAGGRPGFTIDRRGIHIGDSVSQEYILKKTPLEEFSSAKLHLRYSDLEVVVSDGFYLEYALYGDANEPEFKVEKDTFTFQENPGGSMLSFGLFGWEEQSRADSHVTLYVPEGFRFEELGLYSDSGDTDFEELRADRLTAKLEYGTFKGDILETERMELNLDSGDFSVKELNAENLKLYAEYGDVYMHSADIGRGIVEMDSGAFEIDRGIFDSMDIESEYGDVDIALGEKAEGYSMYLGAQYGDISAPEYGTQGTVEELETYRSSGTGNKVLNIRCESGDISVRE